MSSIESRLRRLEERSHGGIGPECGHPPDIRRRPIALINDEHPEKSFKGDPNEYCKRCGKPLYVVLRIVYGD